MDTIFQEFLFSRHILVHRAGEPGESSLQTLVALARLFGIEVARGAALAQPDMIRLAATMLGEDVPLPFYRNFPASVREITGAGRLYDQLVHYAFTYGRGNFSRPGHSILERAGNIGARELFRAIQDALGGDANGLEALLDPAPAVRDKLDEAGEKREFIILEENEAVKRLEESVEAFLASSRPLNQAQAELVVAFVRQYGYRPRNCACKETAFDLLISENDVSYARFFRLSDVTDLAERLDGLDLEARKAKEPLRMQRDPDFAKRRPNPRKLNLTNRSRKLLTAVIDRFFTRGEPDVDNCYARQARWCGLLHHLHYRPVNEQAEAFVRGMRGGVNRSPESAFERTLREEGPVSAAQALRTGRDDGAVLRRLDYLLGRCRDAEEAERILSMIESGNTLIYLQLFMRYSRGANDGLRTFRFVKNRKLHVVSEGDVRVSKNRTRVPPQIRARVKDFLWQRLTARLGNTLGCVYIDDNMRRMALPLQEAASMSGVGVLPRGSRVPISLESTVRGFTYWEKVDDIDLSVFGLCPDGSQIEFSWRTMHLMQEGGEALPIVYSGDETSGYHGGSEYFDVDIAAFRRAWPDVRYLVFCDNIYSYSRFNRCFCRAGYMLRQHPDSGEVFEPKTVGSAFTVNGDGRFAYLFGIDLERAEFVWLNLHRASENAVAGETSLAFLLDDLNLTQIFNVYDLFALMASRLTDDPARADVVVSDAPVAAREGAQVIHSWDYEKLLGLLNAPAPKP